MKKQYIYFLLLPGLLFLGSCASTQTALLEDQNDDVYYSVAKAKEAVEYYEQPRSKAQSDYVTDEELYGGRDYGDRYDRDYAARIYRFRNYSPSLDYYSRVYGYSYDPFFDNSIYSFNYFGGPMIAMGFHRNNMYFGYNPWRFYGYNYGSNFWGPYSYYNTWNNPYGPGFGGSYYGMGRYGYGNPQIYSSPNYRARPGRTSDNIYTGRGSVNGNGTGAGAIKNGGNTVQSRGRAERYGQRPASTPQTSSTTRPQARPERVSQREPSRVSQPERIYSAPRQQDSGSQSGSSGSSRDNSSSGGARPSRAN